MTKEKVRVFEKILTWRRGGGLSFLGLMFQRFQECLSHRTNFSSRCVCCHESDSNYQWGSVFLKFKKVKRKILLLGIYLLGQSAERQPQAERLGLFFATADKQINGTQWPKFFLKFLGWNGATKGGETFHFFWCEPTA